MEERSTTARRKIADGCWMVPSCRAGSVAEARRGAVPAEDGTQTGSGNRVRSRMTPGDVPRPVGRCLRRSNVGRGASPADGPSFASLYAELPLDWPQQLAVAAPSALDLPSAPVATTVRSQDLDGYPADQDLSAMARRRETVCPPGAMSMRRRSCPIPCRTKKRRWRIAMTWPKSSRRRRRGARPRSAQRSRLPTWPWALVATMHSSRRRWHLDLPLEPLIHALPPKGRVHRTLLARFSREPRLPPVRDRPCQRAEPVVSESVERLAMFPSRRRQRRKSRRRWTKDLVGHEAFALGLRLDRQPAYRPTWDGHGP